MMFGLYTPPRASICRRTALPHANRSPMMFKFFGLDEEMAFKSIRDCIDELFESDEIRALMYRVAVEFCGPPIEWPGAGRDLPLRLSLFMPGCWRMIVGGTHRLNGAMVTACLKEGVTMRESSRVKRVIVEDGKAVGVETVDGRRYMARQAVVSGIGLKDTFLDLVGEDELSPYYERRVKNFKDGPDQVLGSVAMALHEAPDYKSAVHDPDINRAWYQVVGYDSAEEVLNYCRAGHVDRIPELPGAGLWVNSIWDPTQAPAGKHNLTGWYFFPAGQHTDRGRVGGHQAQLQRALPRSVREVRAQHDAARQRDRRLPAHAARPGARHADARGRLRSRGDEPGSDGRHAPLRRRLALRHGDRGALSMW